MKYIKNNLDYSVKFTVERNGKRREYFFDCFRTYSDTGNVATTGVTPIDDAEYSDLYANVKVFKKFVDNGSLSLTKKSEANSVASKIDDLAKENKELKEQLRKKTEEAATATSEETEKLKADNKAKEDEIADLKRQLEAAKTAKANKKGNTEGSTEGKDETAGF